MDNMTAYSLFAYLATILMTTLQEIFGRLKASIYTYAMTKNKPLVITYLPTKLLSHRANNARSITREKFEDLQRSLDSWDFAEPLVVSKHGDSYTIVSGHQRASAALELGIASVPCVVREGMTKAQETALGIRLNRDSGEDVKDELAEVLAGLDAELQAMAGFDDLEDLQAAPDFDEDEAPKTKERKYSLDELRTLAKGIYPAQADVILEFLEVVQRAS